MMIEILNNSQLARFCLTNSVSAAHYLVASSWNRFPPEVYIYLSNLINWGRGSFIVIIKWDISSLSSILAIKRWSPVGLRECFFIFYISCGKILVASICLLWMLGVLFHDHSICMLVQMYWFCNIMTFFDAWKVTLFWCMESTCSKWRPHDSAFIFFHKIYMVADISTMFSLQFMGSGETQMFFMDQGTFRWPRCTILCDWRWTRRMWSSPIHEMAIYQNQSAA